MILKFHHSPLRIKKIVKISLLISFWIILVFFLYKFWPVIKNQALLQETIKSFGIWGYIILIIMYFLQSFFFLLFPAYSLTLLSGYIYGPLIGSLLGAIGQSSAEFIIYYFSKTYFKEKALKKIKPYKENKYIKSFLTKENASLFILIKIMPVFSQAAIPIIASFSPLQKYKYYIITFCGNYFLEFIIITFFYQFI